MIETTQMKFTRACRSNDIDTVKQMVKECSFTSEFLTSSLGDAAFTDSVCVVEFLLKHKRVDPTINFRRILIGMIDNNCVHSMKLFLNDPRIDPSIDDNVGIKTAFSDYHYTDPTIVETLVDDIRVNPSIENNICIQEACLRNDVRAVKALLQDPRVDPSINNNYCIKVTKNDIIRNMLLENIDVKITSIKYNQGFHTEEDVSFIKKFYPEMLI